MRAKCLIAALAVAVSLLGTTARSQQAEQKAMTEKIAAGLRESGQLTDYRVGVKYEDGVVWLVGTVTSKEQLQTAVRLTEQIYGVSQVIHDLKVVGTQPTDKPAPEKRGLVSSLNLGRAAAPKRPSQPSNRLSTLKRPTPLAKLVSKKEPRNKKLPELKQPASQLPAKPAKPTAPLVQVASSMLEAKRAPSPPGWITKPTLESIPSAAQVTKKLPEEKQPRSAVYPVDNRLPADIVYAQQQPAYDMPASMTRGAAYPVDNRLPADIAYAQQQPAYNMPASMTRGAAYPIDNRLPAGLAYRQHQPAYNMPAPMSRGAAYPVDNRLPVGVAYAGQRSANNMPVPMGPMPVPPARTARRGGPSVPLQPVALQQQGPRRANHMQAGPCMPPNAAAMGRAGMAAMPMAHVPGGGVRGASYDQSHMPGYAWPTYASYPNYAALTYPRQYSPTAWPYIGPFYPYPQVPLGWRKVALEWDDGWWFLDFNDTATH
jgi:hypothetical protein